MNIPLLLIITLTVFYAIFLFFKDTFSHNLYWCDATNHLIEVYSLKTGQLAAFKTFSGPEIPIALLVIPEGG